MYAVAPSPPNPAVSDIDGGEEKQAQETKGTQGGGGGQSAGVAARQQKIHSNPGRAWNDWLRSLSRRKSFSVRRTSLLASRVASSSAFDIAGVTDSRKKRSSASGSSWQAPLTPLPRATLRCAWEAAAAVDADEEPARRRRPFPRSSSRRNRPILSRRRRCRSSASSKALHLSPPQQRNLQQTEAGKRL